MLPFMLSKNPKIKQLANSYKKNMAKLLQSPRTRGNSHFQSEAPPWEYSRLAEKNVWKKWWLYGVVPKHV
jgi:hypothetical protein